VSTSRPTFSLLSVVSNLERHKLASGEPWLLLMDIEYPGSGSPSTAGATAAQQHVRLVRDLNPIDFDADDGNGLQTYKPFNFAMGDLKIGTDGSVPDCEVQASNVLRALQKIIEKYAGVVGANLYLYAVNTSNPSGEPDLAMAFTVKQTTSDAKLVHFKLGASSPLRRLFPFSLYRVNFCIWQYNSPPLQAEAAAAIAAGTPLADPLGAQCGYLGPLATCTRTIDGPNGCQAHNNVIRFGGFPGIDTNGITVASVV
jgi:phage-related protein